MNIADVHNISVQLFNPLTQEQVRLAGVVPKNFTNDINGHQNFTFDFTATEFALDSLPAGLFYQVYVTTFDGLLAWGGFVYSIQAPGTTESGVNATFTVTCFGDEHTAKTTDPVVTGSGKSLNDSPENICRDVALLGAFNTATGTVGQDAIWDATGNSGIGQRINYIKNQPISYWWDTVLEYGDTNTRWDWSVWTNPYFGLRPSATDCQVYFTRRKVIGDTPDYIVSREHLDLEQTKILFSADQVWTQANYHYQDKAGTDKVYVYTPSPAVTYKRYRPGYGQWSGKHVWFGDLGQPDGGNSTNTTGQSDALAQMRAKNQFIGELSYRLTGNFFAQPLSILRGDGLTPVTNELVRPGKIMRIINMSNRVRAGYIDIFITQTTYDCLTGVLQLTPQSPTDYKSNMAAFFKRPGSAVRSSRVKPVFV